MEKSKNEIINELTEKIWSISYDGTGKNMADFCKLEHNNGEIILTSFGDISEYSESKVGFNITLWRNYWMKKDQIKKQIEAFIARCEEQNLELIISKREFIYNTIM